MKTREIFNTNKELNIDNNPLSFFLCVGAGFDLEPLINISHVYSEFYFVDIDESYGDISIVQKNLVSKINDKYKGKLTFLSGEESYIDKNKVRSFSPNFHNRYWSDNDFQTRVRNSNYSSYTAIIKRCIKSYEKKIKIRFIHGEGLTFYRYLMNQTGRMGLSNNNMICTIQTGVLEDFQNGLMTDFFDNYSEIKPKYWMWGYDPENHARKLIPSEKRKTKDDMIHRIYSFDFWSSGKSFSKSDYRHVFVDDLYGEVRSKDKLSFKSNSKEIILDFQLNSLKISVMRPLVNEGKVDKLITFRPDVLPEDSSFIVKPDSLDSIEGLLNALSDKSEVILEFSSRFFPADYICYLIWLFERESLIFPKRLRITNTEVLNILNMTFLNKN